MKTVLMGVLFAATAFAAPYKVGDAVADMCWQDAAAKKVCLKDFKGKTAVLLYNAGWCGPCNNEFAEITKTAAKYAGGVKGKSGKVHEVVFLSLSCDGWGSGSLDAKFLKEWDAKYGLSSAKAKFYVLASPRDCGRSFQSSPSIPNVAIVAETQQLNYKGVGPSQRKIESEIDWALTE